MMVGFIVCIRKYDVAFQAFQSLISGLKILNIEIEINSNFHFTFTIQE